MERQVIYDGLEHSILSGELEQSHEALLKWMKKNTKLTSREAEIFVNGIIQERHEREQGF